MAYKRGDVVLVLFPNTDLRTAKRRPALVIQDEKVTTGLSQVILSMITTKMSRATHPSRVMISVATKEGQQSGLLTDSLVATDNLATVQEKAIHRKIGTLAMDKVDTAIKYTLGLK